MAIRVWVKDDVEFCLTSLILWGIKYVFKLFCLFKYNNTVLPVLFKIPVTGIYFLGELNRVNVKNDVLKWLKSDIFFNAQKMKIKK